ncbi:MAG: Clp1/GlmU family protein [Candidatus Ozemobacteraceae bacterium]
MTTHSLQRDEFYMLQGPAQLRVTAGVVEIIAARLGAGKELRIPLGKRVPVKVLEDATLEIEAGPEGFAKMDVGSIPSEWDQLVTRILGERKEGSLYTVMVMGEVDTGKTFFSTYLANRLMDSLKRTAILDCDTGQSDIGPPGTFGMLVMKEPTVFLSEVTPTYLYMLGAHSPGLHFLPALTGLDAMLVKARNEADVLVIDTTGWVQGDGGRAIKKAKLDIARPDIVILMQRGNELEHLVKHLPAKNVVRLPVSKKASPTSQMERKSLREHVSTVYFKDAKIIEIPFGQVFTDRAYFLTGTPVALEGTLHAEKLSGWEGTLVVSSGPLMPEMMKAWPDPKQLGRIMNFCAGEEKGVMVGLLDAQQDVLAIGRLEELDFLKNVFRVRTPFKGKSESVKGVQFGSLKLTEKGEEAGFLEPGSI